jgi:hypothetical protein
MGDFRINSFRRIVHVSCAFEWLKHRCSNVFLFNIITKEFDSVDDKQYLVRSWWRSYAREG